MRYAIGSFVVICVLLPGGCASRVAPTAANGAVADAGASPSDGAATVADGAPPADAQSPAGDAAPPASWAHEPAGFHALSDWDFASITGDGWQDAYPNANCTIASDATAPLSPSSVLRMHYPVGFMAGVSPDTIYRSVNGARELYVGFWFKFSDPWQQETMSNVSKLIFFDLPAGGDVTFTMMGPQGGPYHIVAVTELPTSNGHLPSSYGDDPGTRVLNGGGTTELAVGVWHQLEIHLKYGTSDTSRDGIVRWWVDGKPIGDYSTVNFSTAQGWAEVALSPTWGGLNNTKTEDDSLYIDHVRISAP